MFFLRLTTEDKNFKVLHSEICRLLNTKACLSNKSGTYYDVSKIGSDVLKKIGWMLDNYGSTNITILNELEE